MESKVSPWAYILFKKFLQKDIAQKVTIYSVFKSLQVALFLNKWGWVGGLSSF